MNQDYEIMALLIDVIKCDGMHSADKEVSFVEVQCFLDYFMKTDPNKNITTFEFNTLLFIKKHFDGIAIEDYVDIEDESNSMSKKMALVAMETN